LNIPTVENIHFYDLAALPSRREPCSDCYPSYATLFSLSCYPTPNCSPSLSAEPVIWILELHNGPDSRLTASLISDAFMPALDAVERDWRAARRDKDIATEKDTSVGAGALVIVGNTKQDKFFSNGTFELWRKIMRSR
jgi:hypothetical protein